MIEIIIIKVKIIIIIMIKIIMMIMIIVIIVIKRVRIRIMISNNNDMITMITILIIHLTIQSFNLDKVDQKIVNKCHFPVLYRVTFGSISSGVIALTSQRWLPAAAALDE